jgi:hypothetical protein
MTLLRPVHDPAVPELGLAAVDVTGSDGVALGWQIWYATGPAAKVEVLRSPELLQVVLAETGGDPGSTAEPRRPAIADLVLDDRGRCWATHVDSPSLLHVQHADGDLQVVPRDGARSELTVALGGVLVQATPGLLEAVPPKTLASLPRRVTRQRTLASLAADLLRQARTHPAGAGAGVVVVRRLWSSSPH